MSTVLLACTAPRSATSAAPPASGTPQPSPSLASASSARNAAAQPLWRYRVQAQSTQELLVEATFSENDGHFQVDPAAMGFVRGLRLVTDAGATSVGAENGRAELAPDSRLWSIPCARGCRLQYRFALREAASTLNDIDTAIAAGNALIAPPSTWLLRPARAQQAGWLELRVYTPPGEVFLSAFERLGETDNVYAVPTAGIDDVSFTAFGELSSSEIQLGDASIRVGIATAGLGLSKETALTWISEGAKAVADYYRGHLPAKRALVLMMKGSAGDTQGETLGDGGGAIVVRVGDSAGKNARDDWVVVHELLHVNFPSLSRRHAWLSEGLATYVEPIARARAGLYSPNRVWLDLVRGLPQGQPLAGDRGLEQTHTWGRTYWGGALFCLLADVEIRERTRNARSLDDALLGIAAASGSVEHEWSVEQVIRVGDEATGVPVLRLLYDRYAARSEAVDLSALFARLGVRENAGAVSFDDGAPLAALRRAITARTQ